jgi:hypothetical protein
MPSGRGWDAPLDADERWLIEVRAEVHPRRGPLVVCEVAKGDRPPEVVRLRPEEAFRLAAALSQAAVSAAKAQRNYHPA